MDQPDEADLAAIRVLQQLADGEGIEFVTRFGLSSLASRVSYFLTFLSGHDRSDRAAQFAAWLIEQAEVRELYFDDDQLDAVLRAAWDSQTPKVAVGPAVVARRADLEAMLLREPDNLDHRAVYGDWLQAHQDPFGELIARQLAGLDDRSTDPIAELDDHLSEGAEALWGPLAEYLGTVIHLRWRAGFVAAARLGKRFDDPGPYEGQILLRWFLDHRAAMLLDTLELGRFEVRARDQFADLVAVLLAAPRPVLRHLVLDDGAHQNSGYHSGDAGELFELRERLPNLRSLVLRLRSATIDRLDHPTLRRLVWDVDARLPAAFASARLPSLEDLELGSGYPHDDLPASLGALDLPALRWLRVPGTSENVEWLLAGSWTEQLETLDLSGGRLEDDDIEAMLRVAWPRLQHLDLSNNDLSNVGMARALGLCAVVVVSPQRGPELDDDDEFTRHAGNRPVGAGEHTNADNDHFDDIME